jgi:circadian clock protein KaiC
MRSIGIDLDKWVKKGVLKFHNERASSRGLESHLLAIEKMTVEFDAKVFVFDALTDFETMGSKNEVKWLSARLVDFFKSKGITAMFTSLVSANSFEESGVGVSSVMDTWMHLMNVQTDLERNRTLHLIKSRGMAHSNQVREFFLTDKGIELRDIYAGPNGALLGSARLALEAREAAEGSLKQEEIARRRKDIEIKRRAMESRIVAMRAQFESDTSAAELQIKQEEKQVRVLAENRSEMSDSRRADKETGG